MATTTTNRSDHAPDYEGAIVPAGAMRIVPERSRIGFKVRKMGLYYVNGRFTEIDGQVGVGSGGLPERGEVAIQARSVTTRMPPRDWHLRTRDFLDVERYPLITIGVARVDPADDGGFVVHAGFEVHGQHRPASLYGHLHKLPQGHGVAVHLHGTVDRHAFGIRPRQPFDMVVGGEVQIDAELTLERLQ